MKDSGYLNNWDEERRDFEIEMLVMQKVNLMAAALSLDRFKETRDICYQNGLEEAGKGFQNYVELYKYYIKNYSKLGGPTSW